MRRSPDCANKRKNLERGQSSVQVDSQLIEFSQGEAQFSSLSSPQDREYLAYTFIDCSFANLVASEDQCFLEAAGGAVFEAAEGAEDEGCCLFSNIYKRSFNFKIHCSS